MRLFSLMAVVLGFVFQASAQHHGKSHVHGAGKMSIAFEGLAGKVTMESPSESIFGFEHVAKKESDKKKQTAALEKLEKSISEMVVFDPKLECIFKKESIQVNTEGKHSDVDASFAVACKVDPVGSTITFNIQKVFGKLTDVDVQILFGDIQKSVEATKNGIAVELKK